ncbi:MAG: hypothetical protein RI909_1886 [Bacteroidota bacterium]|jgi:hypothetical protein
MKESIVKYLQNVVDDMASQNQKVPVNAMRIEATNIEGNLFAPDWFQYMIYGRGPGKQPPPDRMLAWVKGNPAIYASAKQNIKYLSESGFAFLVGRKIGRDGTDIWQGKRKGIDILGAIDRHLPELKDTLVKEEKERIQTSLVKAI